MPNIRSSTTAAAASGFTVGSVVVAVLLVVVGATGLTTLPTVKPEAATAVVELLMLGVRMPETC
jgi:Tfp pilus assembly protein PilV